MKVQVLHIDDCPNWREAGARVESALAQLGRTDVTVEYRLLIDSAEAAQTPFAGSPTVVFGGADIFPSDGRTSDLACRLYVTPEGFAGLPTEAQILETLRSVL